MSRGCQAALPVALTISGGYLLGTGTAPTIALAWVMARA